MGRDFWFTRGDRLLRARLAENTHNRRRCEAGITGKTKHTGGKRSYTSKGAAKRAAEQFTANAGDGTVWSAYRCRCGRWHTTTKEQR